VAAINTIPLDVIWLNNMIAIQTELVAPPMPFMWCSLPRMVAICAEALAMETEGEFKAYLKRQRWTGLDDKLCVTSAAPPRHLKHCGDL
jgi:hypothetical protein